MYIVNPLQEKKAQLFSLFSTHPPTEERVKILRGMGGAGLGEYEQAYRRALKGEQRLLGSQSLEAAKPLEIRPPSAAAEEGVDPIAEARSARDALLRQAAYGIISCPCGATLKVPPDYAGVEVACPSCGRVHQHSAGSDEAPKPRATDLPPLKFTVSEKTWSSVRCSCGRSQQVSPGFKGTTLTCRNCGRVLEREP